MGSGEGIGEGVGEIMESGKYWSRGKKSWKQWSQIRMPEKGIVQ